MPIVNCDKCGDHHTDIDYHPEFYKYGFETDLKTLVTKFTGNDKEAVPLCDECLSSLLSKADITEEYYHDNFM